MVSSLFKDVEDTSSKRDRMCEKSQENVKDIYASVKVPQHLPSSSCGVVQFTEVHSDGSSHEAHRGPRFRDGLRDAVEPCIR